MASSAAMAVQERCVQIQSSGGNGANLDPCLLNVHSDEFISCGDDFILKARKPYTITKQREKWTETEHKKFVEALKLYGRAWRRVEEHVGTKTAVQIRSHAQKFFTKVTRDLVPSSEESIEIPPPRPKRKPMHPYPRKLVIPPLKKLSYAELTGTESVSEEENQSPTSVLSAVGSDALGSTASNSPNSSPDGRLSLGHELFHVEESSLEVKTRRLKLFGKTVLVTDPNSLFSQTVTNCSVPVSDLNNLMPVQPLAMKHLLGDELIQKNLESAWPNADAADGLDSDAVQLQEKELRKEGLSSTGSNDSEDVEKNLDSETQSHQRSSDNVETEATRVPEFRTSERSAFSRLTPRLQMNNLKGFMPYKKRTVVEANPEIQLSI